MRAAPRRNSGDPIHKGLLFLGALASGVVAAPCLYIAVILLLEGQVGSFLFTSVIAAPFTCLFFIFVHRMFRRAQTWKQQERRDVEDDDLADGDDRDERYSRAQHDDQAEPERPNPQDQEDSHTFHHRTTPRWETRGRPDGPEGDGAGSDSPELPFVKAGMRGDLFAYAGLVDGWEHDGPYAVIDLETTGLSPRKGDRIVEIAIARIDRYGNIEDEFATLIKPDDRDTGPVFVHGITRDAVSRAPRFVEVADEVLARLDGAVVVAHNASFEEAFLHAEFSAAGYRLPPMPALCTLWLGRRTFQAANFTLGTLAQQAGVPLVDKHTALGDVRAVSRLLPRMLDRHEAPLFYDCEPYRHSNRLLTERPRLVTRATALRKGQDGWMASLISRLPMSANDVDDATAEAYFEALAAVMEDGRITGEEAKMLARFAGQSGLGGAQVRSLNERFLENMRETAIGGGVLTRDGLDELAEAAVMLGASGYFDDLYSIGE
ncbi:3'-5' exonuclease [Austwickia chelonae]|uniref:3'-5' exonuclease n=1 Tax=Austwickia chelonae TaxID=100225 RepID=UPI000E237E2A|nr:3'-5' exonuclease [Austwickia chelonae]